MIENGNFASPAASQNLGCLFCLCVVQLLYRKLLLYLDKNLFCTLDKNFEFYNNYRDSL